MTKIKDPVDSFGAELFNAIREGTHRKVTLKLSYRDAVRLRARVHRLRAKMGEQSHPLYGLMMKAELRIEIPPNTPTKASYHNIKTPIDSKTEVTLVILPKDSDFRDAILKAGVSVPPLTEDPTPDTTTATPSLEDLLKDLK